MYHCLNCTPHISESGQGRTHAVIQHVLDFKPSGKDKVPSIGDSRKNEEGIASGEPLNVPDWSQGLRARPNLDWIVAIKGKTCEDIVDRVSQQGISPKELSTHTYYLKEYPRTPRCTEY